MLPEYFSTGLYRCIFLFERNGKYFEYRGAIPISTIDPEVIDFEGGGLAFLFFTMVTDMLVSPFESENVVRLSRRRSGILPPETTVRSLL